MGRLVIDGNSVYELDEDCLRKKGLLPQAGQKDGGIWGRPEPGKPWKPDQDGNRKRH